MMKYKVILVMVDGSEDAEKAFQRSVEIAKANEAQLVIGNVVDTSSFYLIEPYDSRIWEHAEQESYSLLKKYAEKAKKSGLENIEIVTKNGSPKKTIVKDIAPEYSTDLIIVGATGMGRFESFLLGSVSESVTRYAACDVYVVR